MFTIPSKHIEIFSEVFWNIEQVKWSKYVLLAVQNLAYILHVYVTGAMIEGTGLANLTQKNYIVITQHTLSMYTFTQ